MVEPAGEEVRLGVQRSGLVARISVTEGQRVAAGDPVLELDDRAARAEVARHAASLAAAEARAQAIAARTGPLAAQVAGAEADALAARSLAEQAGAEDRRAQELSDPRALSAEERERRASEARTRAARAAAAEARLAELRAELALVSSEPRPGASLTAALADVAAARAELSAAEVDLALHRIVSPLDGIVLAVDTRVGEYLGAAAGSPPAVVLGREALHVRAQFAEEDAPRFDPSGEAFATLRGAPEVRVPLTFVRQVPRLAPRRALGGGAAERVDTRVLEVLYAVDRAALGAAPGQRVDVYAAEKTR